MRPELQVSTTRQRIAILISGRGSNMQSILHQARDGFLRDCCEVCLVVSNRSSAAGLEVARSFGVPALVVRSAGKRRSTFDRQLVEQLEPYRLDYLVLAGFMRVLTSTVIRRYHHRIINIHPADTSAFRGLGAYEWAFSQGLEQTTITVHLVDEGVDSGPVLATRPVDLRGADTLEAVERRGLAVEHQLYSEVLRTLFTNLQLPTSPPLEEQA